MNAFAETGKCRRKNQMPVFAQEVGNPSPAPASLQPRRHGRERRLKTISLRALRPKLNFREPRRQGCNLSPRSYRKNDSFLEDAEKGRSIFHIRVQDRSQMFGQLNLQL